MNPDKRPYGLCDACRMVRRAILSPDFKYLCAACGHPLRNVTEIGPSSARIVDSGLREDEKK